MGSSSSRSFFCARVSRDFVPTWRGNGRRCFVPPSFRQYRIRRSPRASRHDIACRVGAASWQAPAQWSATAVASIDYCSDRDLYMEKRKSRNRVRGRIQTEHVPARTTFKLVRAIPVSCAPPRQSRLSSRSRIARSKRSDAAESSALSAATRFASPDLKASCS